MAALTNNWKPAPQPGELPPLFDVFVESAEVGMRKPELGIYKVLYGMLDVGNSGGGS